MIPVRQIAAKLSILLALLVSFPLADISAKTSKTTPSVKKEDTYVIGREDILDISVWQSPDLTKALTVQSDGTIDYPILGSLRATGLTPPQLATILREKLAQGYVKDPKVTVSVKEYNSKKVLVFGEVAKPGLYKLRGEIPLLEFLFMVGGVNQDAKRMTVIRPPKVSEDTVPSALLPPSEQKSPTESASAIEVDLIALLSKGNLSQNIMIQPGDSVYVASGTGQKYYVLGQVKQPGPYEWVQDITLLEAIKLAQGITERGAPNRIKVRKNYRDRQEVLKINLTDIINGKKKDDVIIKPGDTIIVPESWI